MHDWLFASAGAMADAIRRQKISSRELVALHLDRIAEVNADLNAVVAVAAERALDEAGRAVAATGRDGCSRPLLGVPITIKDSFDTEGIVSTAGTPSRARHLPRQDATVVARLRRAGAIVLGKTNTSELTLFPTVGTTNPLHGRTNNPHDLARSPSGSSGGAAAIIAAGGSALDIGSDTGGSIRDPAHACGIAGIKPSPGRVPRTGHIVTYGQGVFDRLTQIGPMARFVEDLILTLPLICGPDGLDPEIAPIALGDPRAVDVSALRIAYYTENGAAEPSADVADAVRAAAQAIASAGASLVQAVPPGLAQASSLFARLQAADGGAWKRRLLASVQSPTPAGLVDADPLTADAFQRILEDIDAYRSRMTAFMWGFDAVLGPASPEPALGHDDVPTSGFDSWCDLNAHNLSGLPAVVLPAGWSAGGLPIGVQVVGGPWRDDVALAVARAIEQCLGSYHPPRSSCDPRFGHRRTDVTVGSSLRPGEA